MRLNLLAEKGKKEKTTRWFYFPLIVALWWLKQGAIVSSQETQKTSTCPTDLETLTNLMLKDLPAYANRVIQRARRQSSSVELWNYVIIAGRPELQPLPLSEIQYQPLFPNNTQQLFFTTLERQYSQDRAREIQNFHWLFLARTSRDWQVVTVFSQLASLKSGDPPLPPRDSSDGIIGQAIKLWLRDCQAGTLRAVL